MDRAVGGNRRQTAAGPHILLTAPHLALPIPIYFPLYLRLISRPDYSAFHLTAPHTLRHTMRHKQSQMPNQTQRHKGTYSGTHSDTHLDSHLDSHTIARLTFSRLQRMRVAVYAKFAAGQQDDEGHELLQLLQQTTDALLVEHCPGHRYRDCILSMLSLTLRSYL